MTDLPTEIWEMVIFHIHNDGVVEERRVCLLDFDYPGYNLIQRSQRAWLAACCLTCRSWLPRSRYYLYHDIVLGGSMDDDAACVTRFVHCLRAGRRNGALIESLAFKGEGPKKPGIISSALLLVGSLDANFRSLSLGELDMSCVHPSFFRSLAQFKSVRELTCSVGERSTLKHYIQMLSSLPNISSLSLITVEGDAEHHTHETGRNEAIVRCSHQIGLHALRIALGIFEITGPKVMIPLLRWLVDSTATPHNLRRLEISSSVHESLEILLTLNDVLKHCGSSIEDLKLHLYGDRYWPTSGMEMDMTLEHNANLRSLSIGLILAHTTGWHQRLISTMDSPKLCFLRMRFIEPVSEMHPSDTVGLDKALCSLILKHPRLQVEAEIHDIQPPSPYYEISVVTWQELFPSALKTNAFSVVLASDGAGQN
ncbi:unnamed protein product [Somion occarium]|uniref:F-box domain-containing protein n=1 Tax=Somion occarium TaxID=3059160 RepID=A0ABP1DLH4_9APHY